MKAGSARVDITPPLPIDLLGYVRRAAAARAVWDSLEARACYLQQDDVTVVLIAADVVGLTAAFADRVREHVAAGVGCRAEDVLLNSSHSHAAPWPGAGIKMGGEVDGWTDLELAYWDYLPHAYTSAAVRAKQVAVDARVSGGVGRASGLAVNRRERTADGRTILGWSREGFLDDEVPTIRIDAMADGIDVLPIATVVGFGCHPVVVGPLRERLDELRGGLTIFLQGAAGNVLPLEAFQDDPRAAKPFGERLALEAARAVADADPRQLTTEHIAYGSVTPISLYRRRVAADQPGQVLASRRRLISLPLLDPPSRRDMERELDERRRELADRQQRGEGRVTTNPVRYHISWLERRLTELAVKRPVTEVEGEVWAARLGEQAIVAGPGEIFGEIGHAVRRASPASVTIFAGYSNGSLGYVPTREEYAHGGYEPAVSHRGYDLPAPFAPEAGELIRDVAIELLEGLFAADARPPAEHTSRQSRK